MGSRKLKILNVLPHPRDCTILENCNLSGTEYEKPHMKALDSKSDNNNNNNTILLFATRNVDMQWFQNK